MVKIPLIFAINDNYAKQLATAIVSIIKNSKAEYEFNILETGLSSENKEILTKIDKNINFIDMNKVLRNFDLEKYMSRRNDYKYISTETYYRFFIPELFLQYEKAIYLDADILVLDDLEKLWNEDISEYYAGVVEDSVLEVFLNNKDIKTQTRPIRDYETYFKQKLGKIKSEYFNAGVLLLNLDKIRKEGVVSKLWQFTQDESPLEFQDQCVLNAVFENNVKFLDYKWNTIKRLNSFAKQIGNAKKKKNLLRAYKKPSIFHYVGRSKPWEFNPSYDYNYSFIKEWWKYYRQTPFWQKQDERTLKMITRGKDSFLQKIFSIKNTDTHKVFRLLGLKFKLRRKPKKAQKSNLSIVEINELISHNLSVYSLHQKVFSKYKNIHQGKDVVLVATGPSLNNYTPLEDAVHIGVNRAFKFDKVKFDYLFIQDYSGATQDYFDDFMNYENDKCVKFCGILPEGIWPDSVIPESKCIGAQRFYTDAPTNRSKFTRDIASEPFGDSYSIAFPTMQFILWTNPKRIFIVGCDCSLGGHYDKQGNGLEVNEVLKGWERLEKFARIHYPDTEIVSINPVGLKGLFKEITI